MVASVDRDFTTPEEYLAWVATQPERYEYLDGMVYAMTGGTLPHTDIALNIASTFRSRLRSTGCKVRMADARVHVQDANAYFYPDVVVSCADRDRVATDAIREPSLIIEVLSPTTANYDRGDKFKRYRQLPSLREYLLVDSTQVSVDRYHLNDANEWVLTSYPAPGCQGQADWDAIAIDLTSPNLTLTLGEIYEDVILLPPEPPIA